MKSSFKTFGAIAIVLALGGTALAAQDQRWGGPDAGATMTRAEAKAKAEAMFDRMDVNHDGKLDQADRAAMEARKFDELDTDHNGSLSREEFAAGHKRMGRPMGGPEGQAREAPGAMAGEGQGMRRMGGRGGHEAMGGMMMHMADANKDGAVTRDEAVAAALKHFDMMDANKDGKVTPDERKAAMATMRQHMKGMRGPMGGDMPPPPPPAN